ncbi:glutamate/aspartate transport system substrate-binding protein [Bradyrhizobium sp. USDA 326]|uniref:amino acid ABC transporter substrate-binding protein n=1 Tax=unclassified Bradyrhizobium TaxID=2631580 RepID=UPI00102C66B8
MRRMLCTALLLAGIVGGSSAFAEEASPTIDKIKGSQKITIGYRESSVPFSQPDNSGKPEGYSIDLCLQIVDNIKRELNLPNLAVEFVPVNGQTRVPLIANGTIDLECGSTTNTLARGKQVDFLSTTFVTGSRIAVRADSGINEIEDLKGKRIVTAAGSINERVAEKLNKELNLNLTLSSSKDQSQGWLALETGRADAFISDDVILYGFAAKADDPKKFKVTGRLLSFDPYGIMVRRNDAAFRLLGNQALARLFRSGEAVKIYHKWFDPIRVPLSPLLMAAFELGALPD